MCLNSQRSAWSLRFDQDDSVDLCRELAGRDTSAYWAARVASAALWEQFPLSDCG
jgi:hypothetical protein